MGGYAVEPKVLTVSQLNQYLKTRFDNDPALVSVAIQGEISNFKKVSNGHCYFSMKDATGMLKCVMFRSAVQYLRFKPADGDQVVAFGRVTVYPRDGCYQLYVDMMAPKGVGDQSVAFEKLKQKLAAEGLFDEAHKKPIPVCPDRIAVITSITGDAMWDMIRILGQRWPMARIVFLPVAVQGVKAPAELTGAVRYANRWKVADVIILGRGGGSAEDLLAFNDEKLARAIFDSEIPVISAVGHEPDVTISDYVADLRAATPSNAAELAVPDREELIRQLRSMASAMGAHLAKQVKVNRQRLSTLAAARPLQSPTAYLDERRLLLDSIQRRLCAAQQQALAKNRQRCVRLTAALDAMSPLKVLTRGYAMAQTEGGQLLRQVEQVRSGDRFTLQLSDGRIRALVESTEQLGPQEGKGGSYERTE